MFCASELAGIEPTPPAPEEQGMRGEYNQFLQSVFYSVPL
jgi:hypothetical protein